ncbi:hypothetical protein, partial [Acinetobacter baumannii]|uniref:hypothetical protein n=1 Tax=Acinetobacter baumannii TaxID=470 RepID=UPI001C067725
DFRILFIYNSQKEYSKVFCNYFTNLLSISTNPFSQSNRTFLSAYIASFNKNLKILLCFSL